MSLDMKRPLQKGKKNLEEAIADRYSLYLSSFPINTDKCSLYLLAMVPYKIEKLP